MFSDPLVLTRDWSTITANAGSNISMPASERAADHSTYRNVDAVGNDHVFFIGHSYGKRSRFTASYEVKGFIPTVVDPTTNTPFTQRVYVVVDVHPNGPVNTVSSETNILRKQLAGVGGFLIGVAADPLFVRIVNGET